jgi:hypothetical protein
MTNEIATFAIPLRFAAIAEVAIGRKNCVAPPSRGHAQFAIGDLRFCGTFAVFAKSNKMMGNDHD